MYTLHTFIYIHVHVHTRSCCNVFVCTWYKHVCTMFRHVCTILPYTVQVGRIPDVDFDIGPYIGLRYQSPLTSISKSLISQNFDIEAFRLRYRSNSILKILRYRILLRYRSNPISQITTISQLKFIYGYRGPACFDIEDYFDIEAEIHI